MTPVRCPEGACTCGCCAGLSIETPREVYNRPGLSSVARRIGTYTSFRESLLARLSSKDYVALVRLTTRESDDFTIGLLESVAVLGDVLTFYQERIANELYLRTATERVSLERLGELVGYRARPGVAASAELAFEIEDAPGGPARTTIPPATRAQSIPGPGERPQVFETGETIEARPEWNAMAPRLTQPQAVSISMTQVIFKGIATALRPGDSLLIVQGPPNHERVVKRIVRVVADSTSQTTTVDVSLEARRPARFTAPTFSAGIFLAKPTTLTGAVVSSQIVNASWKQSDLTALAKVQSWSEPALRNNIGAGAAAQPAPIDEGVFAFRKRAAVFGHNAPNYAAVPEGARAGEGNWDIPPRTLDAEPGDRAVHLDATYPEIVPGGWVVLESPVDRRIYRVENHDELSRTGFTLSGRVSRVWLDSAAGFDGFTIRATTVLAESERLELAELPIEDPVDGDRVMLDRIYFGLETGRTVIVTGERTDFRGVVESEVHRIADVRLAGGYTIVAFQRALEHTYVRSAVTIAANVAHATHGESVEEVLGSGDATKVFQEFVLRQPPLTWVSADVTGGARASLEVWVDGVRWHEVDALFGHGADERVYVLASDATGITTVRFGDGRTGVRLPTGVENVRAKYRKGIGREGQVAAGQISLLLTRPLGVRGVSNPLAAAGAADPQSVDDARASVPLTVLTLDRIVSLRDYEDFARAFAGVGKALATWSWNGRRGAVVVTVAGPGGVSIVPGSPTANHLITAMQRAGDPFVPVRTVPYRPAFFRVRASVKVNADRQPAAVLSDVETAVQSAFAFEARAFGQIVALADVIAVMQRIPGVIAVNITALHRTDALASLQPWLAADGPVIGDDALLGGELLLLDPRPLELGVMA